MVNRDEERGTGLGFIHEREICIFVVCFCGGLNLMHQNETIKILLIYFLTAVAAVSSAASVLLLQISDTTVLTCTYRLFVVGTNTVLSKIIIIGQSFAD